mmetsp:Transcript_148590/g.272903  ORF Transcript_148590/g.272903 Transcript_148590/m.272903 type:complete len:171 (-) Transcript_148590:48-560(-)
MRGCGACAPACCAGRESTELFDPKAENECDPSTMPGEEAGKESVESTAAVFTAVSLNAKDPKSGKEPAQEAPKTEPQKAAASKAWVVELKKVPENNVVGLEVNYGDSKVLKVTKIKAGLVLKWNLENPEKIVKEGDCIIEINGVSEDNMAMLDLVPKSTDLKIVFERGAV